MSGKPSPLPRSPTSAARQKSSRSSQKAVSPTANEKSPSRSPKPRTASRGSVRNANTSKLRNSSKNIQEDDADIRPISTADTILSVDQGEAQSFTEPEPQVREDPLVSIWSFLFSSCEHKLNSFVNKDDTRETNHSIGRNAAGIVE
jgi:hypothetical protein